MYIDNLYENELLDNIEKPQDEPLSACLGEGCFMNICLLN